MISIPNFLAVSRAAGPAFHELSPQRRQRLALALRALDARAEGNAYRVIAEVLFGAKRIPERAWKTHDLRNRTIRLVLVSTPGPGWHLRRRHEVYARRPLLLGPLFLAETPWRLRRELALAIPQRSNRVRFGSLQLRTVLRAPLSLTRMARRAGMIATIETRDACARISAPTLVVTGEASLDHVVSVDDSAGSVSLIRGARRVVLERTGHLGSITRPADFAAIVREFACGHPDRGAGFLDPSRRDAGGQPDRARPTPEVA